MTRSVGYKSPLIRGVYIFSTFILLGAISALFRSSGGWMLLVVVLVYARLWYQWTRLLRTRYERDTHQIIIHKAGRTRTIARSDIQHISHHTYSLRSYVKGVFSLDLPFCTSPTLSTQLHLHDGAIIVISPRKNFS